MVLTFCFLYPNTACTAGNHYGKPNRFALNLPCVVLGLSGKDLFH